MRFYRSIGARGFYDINQKESDFRHQHAKVHHFQHQAIADKKNHNPSKHVISSPDSSPRH